MEIQPNWLESEPYRSICQRIQLSLSHAQSEEDEWMDDVSTVTTVRPTVRLNCGYAKYNEQKSIWTIRHRAITFAPTGGLGMKRRKESFDSLALTGTVSPRSTPLHLVHAQLVAKVCKRNLKDCSGKEVEDSDNDGDTSGISTPPLELLKWILRSVEFLSMLRQARNEVLKTPSAPSQCPSRAEKKQIDLEPILEFIRVKFLPDERREIAWPRLLDSAMQYLLLFSKDTAKKSAATWNVLFIDGLVVECSTCDEDLDPAFLAIRYFTRMCLERESAVCKDKSNDIFPVKSKRKLLNSTETADRDQTNVCGSDKSSLSSLKLPRNWHVRTFVNEATEQQTNHEDGPCSANFETDHKTRTSTRSPLQGPGEETSPLDATMRGARPVETMQTSPQQHPGQALTPIQVRTSRHDLERSSSQSDSLGLTWTTRDRSQKGCERNSRKRVLATTETSAKDDRELAANTACSQAFRKEMAYSIFSPRCQQIAGIIPCKVDNGEGRDEQDCSLYGMFAVNDDVPKEIYSVRNQEPPRTPQGNSVAVGISTGGGNPSRGANADSLPQVTEELTPEKLLRVTVGTDSDSEVRHKHDVKTGEHVADYNRIEDGNQKSPVDSQADIDEDDAIIARSTEETQLRENEPDEAIADRAVKLLTDKPRDIPKATSPRQKVVMTEVRKNNEHAKQKFPVHRLTGNDYEEMVVTKDELHSSTALFDRTQNIAHRTGKVSHQVPAESISHPDEVMDADMAKLSGPRRSTRKRLRWNKTEQIGDIEMLDRTSNKRRKETALGFSASCRNLVDQKNEGAYFVCEGIRPGDESFKSELGTTEMKTNEAMTTSAPKIAKPSCDEQIHEDPSECYPSSQAQQRIESLDVKLSARKDRTRTWQQRMAVVPRNRSSRDKDTGSNLTDEVNMSNEAKDGMKARKRKLKRSFREKQATRWVKISHFGHISDYHGIQRKHDAFLPLKFNTSVSETRGAIDQTLSTIKHGVGAEIDKDAVAEAKDYARAVDGYPKRVVLERAQNTVKAQKIYSELPESDIEHFNRPTTTELVGEIDIYDLSARPICFDADLKETEEHRRLPAKCSICRDAINIAQTKSEDFTVSPTFKAIEIDTLEFWETADNHGKGRRRTAELIAQKKISAMMLSQMSHTLSFIEEYNEGIVNGDQAKPSRKPTGDECSTNRLKYKTKAKRARGSANIPIGNLQEGDSQLAWGLAKLSSDETLDPLTGKSTCGSCIEVVSCKQGEAVISNWTKLSDATLLNDYKKLQQNSKRFHAMPTQDTIETLKDNIKGLLHNDDGHRKAGREAALEEKAFVKVVRGYRGKADQERIEKKEHEEERALKLREYEYRNRGRKSSPEERECTRVEAQPIIFSPTGDMTQAGHRPCPFGLHCSLCGPLDNTDSSNMSKDRADQIQVIFHPRFRRVKLDDIDIASGDMQPGRSGTPALNFYSQASVQRLKEMYRRLLFIENYNKGLIHTRGNVKSWAWFYGNSRDIIPR